MFVFKPKSNRTPGCGWAGCMSNLSDVWPCAYSTHHYSQICTTHEMLGKVYRNLAENKCQRQSSKQPTHAGKCFPACIMCTGNRRVGASRTNYSESESELGKLPAGLNARRNSRYCLIGIVQRLTFNGC